MCMVTSSDGIAADDETGIAVSSDRSIPVHGRGRENEELYIDTHI